MAPQRRSAGLPSRQRLLQSAKRLFATQGYEHTATSAIARNAGTSESQLMRYFGGKAGLLEAVFEDEWLDLNAKVQHALAPEADSRSRILIVLETIVGALARDQDLATLMLFEGRRRRGDEPRFRVSQGFVVFTTVVKNLVREAQATRQIAGSVDAAAATAAILGACEAMIRDRLLARAARSRPFAEKEIRRTLEAMLAGFADPAGRRVGPRRRATAAGRVR
jgi:AcrR family transcriptional regulator